MDKKISFFGASVTQQKDGYWKYFSDLNPFFTINNFGYGSRHLNDAGICYIDTVLETNPDYCFIDWFSTGYIKYNEDKFDEITEYIDTIIYKFYSNNVKLIFLIIPDISVDKKDIYKKIHDYLIHLNIPTINISESFEDLGSILRDGIHTTPLGSQEYGRLISEYFNQNIYDKIQIPDRYPSKTKYCEIKTKELNVTVTDKLVLKGPCEIIGISQFIGPYTGIVDIDGVIINNWDRWCYYEREMVNLKFEVKDITTIKILEDDFDRSTCEQHTNWNIKKMLKLITCFYIGENLTILENI
jgi:hypothetical protein